MLRWRGIELSAGGFLLLALLWYLDGEGILPWALAAALLHECGHWCAIRLCGGRVIGLRLTAMGAEMRLSAVSPLRPLPTVLCALAGPGVNLIAAVCASHAEKLMGERAYLFAGLNLGLAIFNLMPLRRLDGGRALCAWLSWLWSDQLGEAVTAFCRQVLLLLFLTGGLVLLWEKQNATLLITAVGLTFLDRKEKYGRI